MIDLEVPTDVVVRRLENRRVCITCGHNYSVDQRPKYNWSCDHCGGEVVQRDDDKPEAIQTRLELYERQTKPLIDWYRERQLLASIDGTKDPDGIFQLVVDAIEARRV